MTSQPNADRPGGYPVPAHSPQTSDAFHLYREVDRLGRDIADNRNRIDALDQHGSRGVDALKTQIEGLRKDFNDHEGTHTEAAKIAREAAQQAATHRRWLIGTIITLILPLYGLLLTLLVTKT